MILFLRVTNFIIWIYRETRFQFRVNTHELIQYIVVAEVDFMGSTVNLTIKIGNTEHIVAQGVENCKDFYECG